jgi:hypothetical protein
MKGYKIIEVKQTKIVNQFVNGNKDFPDLNSSFFHKFFLHVVANILSSPLLERIY